MGDTSEPTPPQTTARLQAQITPMPEEASDAAQTLLRDLPRMLWYASIMGQLLQKTVQDRKSLSDGYEVLLRVRKGLDDDPRARDAWDKVSTAMDHVKKLKDGLENVEDCSVQDAIVAEEVIGGALLAVAQPACPTALAQSDDGGGPANSSPTTNPEVSEPSHSARSVRETVQFLQSELMLDLVSHIEVMKAKIAVVKDAASLAVSATLEMAGGTEGGGMEPIPGSVETAQPPVNGDDSDHKSMLAGITATEQSLLASIALFESRLRSLILDFDAPSESRVLSRSELGPS